jgi:hypothetical protein
MRAFQGILRMSGIILGEIVKTFKPEHSHTSKISHRILSLKVRKGGYLEILYPSIDLKFYPSEVRFVKDSKAR